MRRLQKEQKICQDIREVTNLDIVIKIPKNLFNSFFSCVRWCKYLLSFFDDIKTLQKKKKKMLKTLYRFQEAMQNKKAFVDGHLNELIN